MMNNPLSGAIELKHVYKSYDDTPVLKDISFVVRRGESKIILGGSGSGKSTILKLIIGLEKADEGEIWVDGEEISTYNERKLMEVRKKIGMVFQEGALFDSLSVGQNQGRDAAKLFGGGTAAHPKVIARIYGNQGDYGTTKYKQGQDQFLKPLIAAGKLKVACESYTPGWDPAKAQSEVEQCLTKTNNRLDGIVVMNDGTAGGAIAALKSQNLLGKVPVVGGQDADLQAIQYILLGYQYDTVYKPFKLQASEAASLTADVLKDGKLPAGTVDGYVPNGFMKPGVPAKFLPVQLLHKDTINKVVDDGVWTWKQICAGATARTPTCVKELKGA